MSNHNEAYRAPNDGEVVKGSVANGHPAESSVCRRISICLLATLVVCLLIFPIITIPILFTMIRDKKTTTSPTTAMSVSSSYSTVSAAATTSNVGGASMTSKGGVQAGGGTTIYKGVGTIETSGCPKYLSAAAVFDNKFIVSNADRATGLGTVRVMQIDSSRKGTTLASNTSSSDMYQVATLNHGTGLFITISQGLNGLYGGPKKKSAIIAGKVNPAKGFGLSLGSPVSYADEDLGSIAPSLTSLSNNSFAFTYYMNVTVYTRYGALCPFLNTQMVSFTILCASRY